MPLNMDSKPASRSISYFLLSGYHLYWLLYTMAGIAGSRACLCSCSFCFLSQAAISVFNLWLFKWRHRVFYVLLAPGCGAGSGAAWPWAVAISLGALLLLLLVAPQAGGTTCSLATKAELPCASNSPVFTQALGAITK
jgi:hypothetical protein